MKYKIVEGIATADVAYKVYGETLEELFVNAGEAVTSTMVDISMVKPSYNLELRTKNLELEELLLDFLNELVFLKDTKQMLFSRFDVRIKERKTPPRWSDGLLGGGGVSKNSTRFHNAVSLNANLWGEKIDPKKHHLKCDVKAVTRYKLEIKKNHNDYFTTVVLDI